MTPKSKRQAQAATPAKTKGGISLPREALVELAQVIAKALRQGHSIDTREFPLGSMLAADPDMVVAVVDLLAVEMRKKRVNEYLCEAYLTLIGLALAEARLAGESNVHGPMTRLADRLRAHILEAAKSGRLPPEGLFAIGQRFAAAKIDFGDALRQLTTALVEEGFDDQAELPIETIDNGHADLARFFENDPFEIHAQMSERLAAIDDAKRAEIVASFVSADVLAVRDAGLGWLLDPSLAVSRRVALELAAAASHGLVSAEAADRMVLMRSWLPVAVQADLDAAIRAYRQRGATPAARPIVQISAAVGTGSDGSGAQSFFVLLRRGRKFAIAALLVKHGFGLRDAWVRDDLSRQEADEFINQVATAMDVFYTSPEVVVAAIGNALAVSAERNEPPPFGLVRFVEATGLREIGPERVTPEVLISQLLDQVPPGRRSAAAVSAALASSKSWPDQFIFLQSWFEADEAAHKAAGAHRGKKQQREAVLNQLLPSRRARWAELLAWTAKAAQDEPEDDPWVDFALVANELLGARPLAEIPVASWIAKNTVEALGGH